MHTKPPFSRDTARMAAPRAGTSCASIHEKKISLWNDAKDDDGRNDDDHDDHDDHEATTTRAHMCVHRNVAAETGAASIYLVAMDSD